MALIHIMVSYVNTTKTELVLYLILNQETNIKIQQTTRKSNFLRYLTATEAMDAQSFLGTIFTIW